MPRNTRWYIKKHKTHRREPLNKYFLARMNSQRFGSVTMEQYRQSTRRSTIYLVQQYNKICNRRQLSQCMDFNAQTERHNNAHDSPTFLQKDNKQWQNDSFQDMIHVDRREWNDQFQ